MRLTRGKSPMKLARTGASPDQIAAAQRTLDRRKGLAARPNSVRPSDQINIQRARIEQLAVQIDFAESHGVDSTLLAIMLLRANEHLDQLIADLDAQAERNESWIEWGVWQASVIRRSLL